MKEITTVCIVGPGRMGTGIATALLSAGLGVRVFLLDIKKRPFGSERQALERARNDIERNLLLLRDLGEFKGEIETCLAQLILTREEGEELKQCAVVFETLPERTDLKQTFLRDKERCFHPRAVIASATSSIDLRTFYEAAQHEERIVITHWLNPAFLIPLVEVATTEKTAGWAAESILGFLGELRKVPVQLQNSPGFIIPRIQVAAMNEAIRIIEEGVAGAEEVDTAVKAGFGFRLAVLGLIEFIDLGGVDILYYAGRYLHQELGHEHYRPLESVSAKMERNEVGPRSGKGFYDYNNVDTDALFRKRYRAFVELLNLIRTSNSRNFQGGIKD
ncbi:MAG: 3-hydroxyacyl-CoA dehydrogenase NAD-binding domain-containing protein [Thermodesulfobacteriota bacterium]